MKDITINKVANNSIARFIISKFFVISTQTAEKMGLQIVDHLQGYEKYKYKCRSIYKDDNGNRYRVDPFRI